MEGRGEERRGEEEFEARLCSIDSTPAVAALPLMLI